MDELCAEWEPEPLAPVLPEERRGVDTPVLTGDMGTHVDADGKRLLNLASANFLGLAGDESIRVGRMLSWGCKSHSQRHPD